LNNFSKEVREYIWNRAGWTCEIRGKGCTYRRKLQVHHIIPNTKDNRKKYGNKVIQSPDNGVLVCENCHTQYAQLLRSRDDIIKIKNRGLKDERFNYDD